VIVHRFEVFADYHQFYLWDAGVAPDAPTDYVDDDAVRMVKVAPHIVVIQPVRNMVVPVEVQLHARDPGYDPHAWDHVAECALDLPTGQLQVHECTGGPVLDLAVTPGTYRVRAAFAGLHTLSADGVDGDDRYTLVLWPGPAIDLTIVKQWRG
jgi:hypothetical protein